MNLLCLAVLFVFPSSCQYQPYDEMPMIVTAYNWNHGDVNCNEECDTLATGVKATDDLIGRVAACPAAWVRLDRTAVITIYGIDYMCLDNFGAVVDRHPVYWRGEWCLRVDLALHEPKAWGVQIVGEWDIRWEPRWQ